MLHVKAQILESYEWKNIKVQLPYFIDEKLRPIAFISIQTCFQNITRALELTLVIICSHILCDHNKTASCSQHHVFVYDLFYVCPSKGLSGPCWISFADTKARSIFRSTLSCSIRIRKKSLWYVFTDIFFFGWFSSREKNFVLFLIKHIVN